MTIDEKKSTILQRSTFLIRGRINKKDTPKIRAQCYKKEKPAERKLLTAGVSIGYKKDIFGSFAYEFELSQFFSWNIYR